MLSVGELFDTAGLPDDIAGLLAVDLPWQVLTRLDAFGMALTDVREGAVHPSAVLEGPVAVMEGASVGPYAQLIGPVLLLPGAKVGHAAYVRGPVVLAEGAYVGHATEVKRSLFLPDAKAPHFNYVGDSVLGRHVNLGAGVKLANFKTFGNEVKVAGRPTGLRKLGALLGDHVSIGCNAVSAPGTIVGKGTIVYQGATISGEVPPDSIVKYHPALETVPQRQ